MKRHNISISKPSSSDRGHALSTRDLHAFLDNWIFVSGASHHMNHSNNLLPSPSDCSDSQIAVGEYSWLDVCGSSTVQLDDGCIKNVLLMHDISTKLLSIYQICDYGDGEILEFSPNDVVI